MRRRRLLGALGTGALLAGCVDRPGRRPTDAAGDGTAVRSTGTTEPGDPTRTTDGGGDGRSLAVERVETFDYVLSLNDLGKGPDGHVPSLSEFDEREREVLASAIDDGHGIDDLQYWLVGFLSEVGLVTRDGTYYRISADLPTYTVTAEPTTEGAVNGEIASSEAYRRAVTHDGRVTTDLLRSARRDGYTTTDPWPKLLEFLDRYDAVRYHGDLLAVSLSVDDPGPPYAITAERLSPAEVAERSVWDARNASPAVRETLRSVVGTRGPGLLDDPPDGLLAGLDGHERLYLDGRFYTTSVEKRGPLPVSVTATVPDAGLADGARLRLALRNDADGTAELVTGAPRPFGVLRYHPAGKPDDRRTLWTEAYRESEYVRVEDGEVTMVLQIGLGVALDPGETVARTYTVRETDLPPGEYVVQDSVEVDLPEQGGSFPFRVVFSVE